jgi:hypothetical protein
MHQTTVRFGPDLWEEIEVEAERAGVSVAQYVRDSALMRVAYTRGREGDDYYDAADVTVAAQSGVLPRRRLHDAAERTRANVEDAFALVSQTAQAVRHGKQLSESSGTRGLSPAGDADRDAKPKGSGARS